jgi:uncharacterized phage protein (TIGR01671 family)
MREIKFRVWDGEKMVYPDKDGWYNECKFEGSANPQSVRLGTAIEKLTVLQYTGLKDKNGKEIYTGDIIEMVRIKDKKNCFVYFVGQVTDHGFAGITIDAKNDYMDFECKDYSYEVIGNIYENQVLLK